MVCCVVKLFLFLLVPESCLGLKRFILLLTRSLELYLFIHLLTLFFMMINSHAHKILPLFRNKVGVDSDILSVLDHSSQKSVFKGNQIP